MTRFMMTMDEAIDLVFFAFENGKNGEIFVRKSPATSIEILIKSLEKILGKKKKIKIIGPRHGEKFHETLVTHGELNLLRNTKIILKSSQIIEI